MKQLATTCRGTRRSYTPRPTKPAPPGLPDLRGWMVVPFNESANPFSKFRAYAYIESKPVQRLFRTRELAQAFADQENAKAAETRRQTAPAEAPPAPAEPLLTTAEVCARLKMKRDAFKEARERLQIPFFKVSRQKFLYRWSEVQAALEAPRIGATLPEGTFRVDAYTENGRPERKFIVRDKARTQQKYFRTEEAANAYAKKVNAALGRPALAPLPDYVRGADPATPYRVMPCSRPVTPYLVTVKIEGKHRPKYFRTQGEALTFANRMNLEVERIRLAAAEAANPTPVAIPDPCAPAPAQEQEKPQIWTEAQLTGLERHKLASSLMKGPPFRISAVNRPPYSHEVCGMLNGDRKRKFFRTEREAKTYAHMRNTEAMQQGTAMLVFPDWLRVMAQNCHGRLQEHGLNIEDATRFMLEHVARTQKSILLSKLVPKLLEVKKSAGVTKTYVGQLKKSCNRFIEAIGDVHASEVKKEQIDQYLAGLSQLNPTSKNCERRMLVTMFNYGKALGFNSTNPAEESETFKTIDSPVGILTPEQLANILAHASAEMLPFFAIGAFAGLRNAELQRLDWAQVDLADGFIEVTAQNSKSARRRIVKILPALDAWIRPHAKQAGKVYPYKGFFPSYHAAAVLKAAGMEKWPKNALRHSFASYHIAQFKDAAALALEMGHTTTALIFAHYRQVVRSKDAARWWEIMPAQVAEAGKVVNFGAGAK